MKVSELPLNPHSIPTATHTADSFVQLQDMPLRVAPVDSEGTTQAPEITATRHSESAHPEKSRHLLAKIIAKTRLLFREEFAGLHPRLFVARLILWPLPLNVGGRLRVRILRLAGFHIGHGTVMADMPQVTGGRDLYDGLIVGKNCWFNIGCFFDLGAAITIGDNVSFGQQVMVLTHSHDIGAATARAAALYAKPVTIGSGTWLGARVTILPGVNIGAGAVVAAGAIVHKDVPANTLVAGIPARIVRSLG